MVFLMIILSHVFTDLVVDNTSVGTVSNYICISCYLVWYMLPSLSR